MIQSYFYFSEDHNLLQLAGVNTSLRDTVYNSIHFLPFSSRENWRRYYSNVPIFERERAVRGYLNKHVQQIKDPHSLPIPIDITSLSDLRDHSPLHASWGDDSPFISTRPAFPTPVMTALVTHAPSTPPPQLTSNVDIDTIIKVVIQVTPAANAVSVTATQTDPSLAQTLAQPAEGIQYQASTVHPTHPQPSDIFFLKAWNGDLHSFPIFQS